MTYTCRDIESGREVARIANVAAARLTGAVLTSGQALATVASTADLWPGMQVVGKGIPANTVVLSVDSAATFTMSTNATADLAAGVIVARGYITELVVREMQLEHYRDIFSGSTPMQVQVAGSYVGDLETPGFGLIIETPVVGAVAGSGEKAVAVSGTLGAALSDDLTHTPPREQVQKVSCVFFVCTDGAILPVPVYPNLIIAQEAAAA